MKTLAEIAGGLPDYDPQALRVAHAQRIIADFIEPLRDRETASLRQALGRVLAEDIPSPIDVPAHDNSAMDGYAFHGSYLRAETPTSFQVIGSAFAGHPYPGKVEAGQCIRIMTGAVMPPACDTVVPQEKVLAQSDTAVTVAAGVVKPGVNRRQRGEDLRAGMVALQAGRLLRPAELGLLASLGIAQIPVQRRLRVAFFSTGDELRSLGETLDPGCVYDSNRYTLYGMLSRLGCEAIDLGVVKDDPVSLDAALRTACAKADAVITTGGASAGDADYLRQAAAAMGDMAFWGMAMRPGRPFAFGRIAYDSDSAYLFGLPGNPVATMVSFYVFVRAALLQLMGAQAAPLPLMRASLQTSVAKRPGRTEYLRGIVAPGADGTLEVRSTGTQGSGILRSMSEANCLVVLDQERGNFAAGEIVDVLLFDGLV